MRIVEAAEAVAHIRSGQSIYVHGAQRDARHAPRGARGARRRSSRTSSSSTSTSRGPGRTWRRRWRATSATSRCSSAPTRARRSTRGAPSTSRRSCRTCRTSSGAASCRSTRCSSTSRRPTPTASARWAPRWMRTLAAIESADLVIAQLNRCMPRTLGDAFVHQDDDRLRRRGRPAAARARAARASASWSGASASYVADLVPDGAVIQMGIGADPGGRRPGPDRQARPGHPHRDVHGRAWSTWSSRARSPAAARRSTGARS